MDSFITSPTDQIIEYRGFKIRITAIRPTGPYFTYRATYQVQQIGASNLTRTSGAITGAFYTAEAVIEGATNAAKQSIDQRLQF